MLIRRTVIRPEVHSTSCSKRPTAIREGSGLRIPAGRADDDVIDDMIDDIRNRR